MSENTTGTSITAKRHTDVPTLSNMGPISPFSPGRPETNDERWIQEEWRKRMAIMQALVIEAQYADNAMAYLKRHGLSVYVETASFINEVREADRAEALKPYIDEYCKRVLESLATHQFGLYEVANTNIAYTVHREHYPPENTQNQRGFLSRLFGS